MALGSELAVDSASDVSLANSSNNSIRKGNSAPGRFFISGPGFGLNGDQFGFVPAGQSVVVEVSTVLVSWLPLWTNTFTGALNFTDPQSGVYSNRSYRARIP